MEDREEMERRLRRLQCKLLVCVVELYRVQQPLVTDLRLWAMICIPNSEELARCGSKVARWPSRPM